MGVGCKGGDRLEAHLAGVAKKLAEGKTLRVGFLESETYPDGTNVAQVAYWNEYGTKSSPPRPFFRSMISAKSSGWGRKLGTALIRSDYDGDAALSVMGNEIGKQLNESIAETTSPALSPITVMLRGMHANNTSLVITGKTVGEAAARVAAGKTNYGASDKPLHFTGQMQDSIGFDIEGGE